VNSCPQTTGIELAPRLNNDGLLFDDRDRPRVARTEAKPVKRNCLQRTTITSVDRLANRRKRIRHGGAQVASSPRISDAGARGPVKEPAQSKRVSQDDLIQLVRELYECIAGRSPNT
jgi:hypothetical protein